MTPGPGGPVIRAVTPDERPGTNGITQWGPSPVALTRSPRGWTVVSPHGVDAVSELVEGLTLADLVAEEFGVPLEPDRATRRSARGPGGTPVDGAPQEDPVDARIAALERTVAQLEHALAARVSTERAIGVLAERHRVDPRAAFETLRRDARSQGRPVYELARGVLAELPDAEDLPAPVSDQARPLTAVSTIAPPYPRSGSAPARLDTAVADGRP